MLVRYTGNSDCWIDIDLLGRRQAVRHQVLILACVGSNPAAPAIFQKLPELASDNLLMHQVNHKPAGTARVQDDGIHGER